MNTENFDRAIELYDSLLETGQQDSEFLPKDEMVMEWEAIKIAVEAVRLGALRDIVANCRKRQEAVEESIPVTIQSYEDRLPITVLRTDPVSPGAEPEVGKDAIKKISPLRFTRVALASVAAVFVISLGIYVVARIGLARGRGDIEDYFESYSLGSARGDAKVTNLERYYNQGDWSAVVTESQKYPANQESLFLSGMAEMQLGRYKEAESCFSAVQKSNKGRAGYFEDEADYYKMLCDIELGSIDTAITEVRKIRNDPSHLYYRQAQRISILNLWLLGLKRR